MYSYRQSVSVERAVALSTAVLRRTARFISALGMIGGIRMKKRLLSSLLVLVMLVSLLPSSALAVEDGDVDDQVVEIETEVIEEFIPIDPDILPDNDELFAGYVEQTMYADFNGGISLFSTDNHTAGSQLTDLDAKIYTALEAKIKEVANGRESSTQFTLSWADLGITQTIWTATELGVTAIVEDNSITSDTTSAIQAKVGYDSTQVSTIVRCLMMDYPYELYWYDKTEGTLRPSSVPLSAKSENGEWKVLLSGDGLTFSFAVASAYSNNTSTAVEVTTEGGSKETKNYFFNTDTTKTAATSTAVTNALQIVSNNKDKSDYDKLVAYRNYICEQVSYNSNAAASTDTPYGDPWQLIYVFDNDSTTDVVCEGYSKAFQYLCDLTDFTNDQIQCYTVTGTTSENHMWNIVTMDDGNNYLVDVTNCDTGSIGSPDKLFLTGTNDRGGADYNYKWTFNASNSISYRYDESTTALWGSNILTLANSNYTPPVIEVTPAITAPSAAAITYGNALKTSTLTGGVATSNSQPIEGTWSWEAPNTIPQVSDSNTTLYTVVFTPNDKEQYTTATCQVTITINPKSITPTVTISPDSYEYTGSEIIPASVTVQDGDITIPSSEYTLSYSDNTNAGSSATVTVTDNSGGNYSIVETSATFNIAQSTPGIIITPLDTITYDGKTVTAGTSSADLTYTYTGDGNVTVNWYADNNGSIGSKLQNGAPKDAGAYWIGISAAAGTNYTAASEVTQRFTISCANYTYDYGKIADTVTVGATCPTSSTVTATGVNSETVSGTLSWYTDSSCSTQATGTFTTPGSTTLYWKFTPNSSETNYVTDPQTGSITYTVSALPAQQLTFTDSTVSKTYGDGSFSYAATNSTSSGGTITYTSNNTTVATVDTSGMVTINGAGTATITATAAAVPNNYAATSVSYTLTVNPKQITATVTANNKTYDGSDTATVSATADTAQGVLAGDTVTITGVTGTFADKNVGTDKAVNVNSSNVSSSNTNYIVIIPTSTTASITAKSITILIADIPDQTYNSGSEVRPAVQVTSDDLVGGDTLTQDTDYTVEYTDNTNVGQATVTVKAKENSNYTFTEQTANFNITQTINSISVNVTAPVKGAAPAASATLSETGINFDSITWYPGETGGTALNSDDTFAANTVYRAEISYTLANGYSIASNATITASSGTATIDTASQKITIVYPAISDRDALSGTVSIDGTATYGQTLTANTTNLGYGTESLGTLSYQWERNDTAISGATESTYTLTEADIGAAITVTVTNSNNSGSVTSNATAAVTKANNSATATAATATATSDTVTVNNVTSGQEYAVTTGTTEPATGWQDTGVFTGLNANTAYTIYTRIKETATTKASGSTTTSVTTDKLTQTITVTNTTPSVTFGGTLDLGTLCSSNASSATLTYTATALPTGTSFSGSTVTAGNVAGSFTVTVSSDAVGDYKSAESVTITIAITDKTDASVSISGMPSNVNYGDTITLTGSAANAGTGTGTWTWTSSNPDVLTISGNTATPTVTILKVGSATVTAAYESDTTQGSGTTNTVIVAAKPITITDVQATDRDYAPDNTTVTLTGGILNGVINNDDVSFTLGNGTITDADAGIGKPVATSIILAGNAAGNYTLTQPTGITVTINKIDPAGYTAPSGITATFGKTLADATIGTAGTGAGTWTWATPTNQVGNVGTNNHDMVFTPTDSTNYNTITTLIPVIVGKAAAPTLTSKNVSVKYNETAAQTVSLTGLMPADAGTLTYTAGVKTDSDSIIGSWSVTGGTLTYTLTSGLGSAKAGKTAALPVTIGSANYESATVSVTITLTDLQTQAPLTITSGADVTYGGTLTLTTAGGSGSGAVTYTVTNGTGAATVSGSTLTPTKAGTVTIVAVKAADGAYAAATSAPVTITIAKATPTGKPAYTAIKTSGKTLAASGLTTVGGTFSVPGTVAWDLPETTTVKANTAYTWTFTPENDNYAAISGKITLWRYTEPSTPSTPSTPSRPSTGSNTSSNVTLPVTTDDKRQDGVVTTETTAAPKAKVRGDQATADISSAIADEIVRQAMENGSHEVVIAPVISGGVTKTEVSIPASAVGEIGSKTDAVLTVSTPVAAVTIPNGGLSGLATEGGAITVTAEKQGNTVDLSVTAGSKAIDRIPGGITLTVPHNDCRPGTVAVLVNASGATEVVRKSLANDGALTVTIPLDGSAKLEIVDNSKAFLDVPFHNWAADAVAFVSAHELFNGTSETTFSPEASMTRSMLAVVLHNLENNPSQRITNSFSDVSSTWYTEAVCWAVDRGIVTGYPDGTFGPEAPITREQLAVMLWRYAGSPISTGSFSSFTDADEISDYAVTAMRWAVENGVMNGKGGGILDPKGTATRAEVAQMLQNMMENVG